MELLMKYEKKLCVLRNSIKNDFLPRKFRFNKKVKHFKNINFNRLITILMKCEKIINC